MKIVFLEQAWTDYQYWVDRDKKKCRRIKEIIKDIGNNPFEGIGKPEPLKHNLAGWWSRRMDGEHRLVYRIKDKSIEILSCRFHY